VGEVVLGVGGWKLEAAHMNNFFDLEVREIIAKPRQRKGE
jgi:hypothetical protein